MLQSKMFKCGRNDGKTEGRKDGRTDRLKTVTVRITKWHNSCNTDPSAPIFLQNVQCLMVKVC